MLIKLSDRAAEMVMNIIFMFTTVVTYILTWQYCKGTVTADILFVSCAVEVICSILVAAYNAVCYFECKN